MAQPEWLIQVNPLKNQAVAFNWGFCSPVPSCLTSIFLGKTLAAGTDISSTPLLKVALILSV
jgi:hypothetical protein